MYSLTRVRRELCRCCGLSRAGTEEAPLLQYRCLFLGPPCLFAPWSVCLLCVLVVVRVG